MIKRRLIDCITLVGRTPQKYEGEKVYVSTGAVDRDHIDYEETERVTYEGRPSRANLAVENGDVIFAKMCATEKTLLINSESEKFIYSTGFCAVRANSKVLSTECLYHLLTSEQFLWQKDVNCSGATQKAITNAGLSKIYIGIPSLDEQRELTTVLDLINYLIGLHREEIFFLDSLVKSRFIEMFGDPVDNPFDWPTKSLMSMGYCKNGMNFHMGDKGIDIHCLGVGDFKDLSVIDGTDDLPLVSLNEQPPEECLLKDDDIVFVRSNGNKALVGRCLAVYPHNVPTTYSGFCIRYRRTGTDVETQYLLRVLKMESMRKLMTGRGANIQNLNQQILAALDIPIPPLDIQADFAAFVQATDKSKLYNDLEVAA